MPIEIVEWENEGEYWDWLLGFPGAVAAGRGLPATPEGLWEAFCRGETEAEDEDGEVWAWGQHWGHHLDLLAADASYAGRFRERA